jgi:hypothetical protein
MEMETKIKELALSDALTSALLEIEDLKKLKEGLVTRSQISDAENQRSAANNDRHELLLDRFERQLDQWEADRQLCARLNLIADHKPTPEEDAAKGNLGNGKIRINIVK